MKAWPLSLVIIFLLTLSVHAEENVEPDVKLALELLDAMELERMNREMTDQMIEMQISQQPSLAPFRGVLKKFFSDYLAYDSIKYEYAVIYLDVYTLDEIRDLIAFYNTPTGKKSIDASADLYLRISRFATEVVESHLNELHMRLQKEAERIEQLQQNSPSDNG